ncbi:DinB family protein [candidate division GN15 bacterium]|nr:DinB family protein [candidate division GN15 bacterium]
MDLHLGDSTIHSQPRSTMDQETKKIIWSQFGAAIDTLEQVIKTCPDEVWFDASDKRQQIWYWVSHTLFWLDYYLSEDHENFRPPEPFGMEEMDPAGVVPDPPYSREQLQVYLEHCREKARRTIREMTPERAHMVKQFGKRSITHAELMLYNLRHVQHHSAQMNTLMRQRIDKAAGWVFQAGVGLED